MRTSSRCCGEHALRILEADEGALALFENKSHKAAQDPRELRNCEREIWDKWSPLSGVDRSLSMSGPTGTL